MAFKRIALLACPAMADQGDALVVCTSCNDVLLSVLSPFVSDLWLYSKFGHCSNSGWFEPVLSLSFMGHLDNSLDLECA